jgi:PAS domain S-box-containing protein/putative nucleotidyltransferase with HDIG domain
MSSRPADLQDNVCQLIDALNCGAALIERDGLLSHANPRFCEMVGRPLDKLVGRDVRTFYNSPEAQQLVAERLANFTEPFEGELLLPRADGHDLPVIVSGRGVGGGDAGPIRRLVTFIDISQQKKAEARATDLYEEMAALSDTVLAQAMDLKDYSRTLEERVRQRTAELLEAHMQAIYMLAVASEAKDSYTGTHVRRIQYYTEALARALGLDEEVAREYGYSAILHDVGKMTVPDRILKKPAPLTDDERRIMNEHAAAGERILSKSAFFAAARQIARGHHENWDGSGYPDGLAGSAIPLCARIVHLADVFDALISRRPYKDAWSLRDAVEAIDQGSGTQFDPAVVHAFHTLVESGEIERILRENVPDEEPELASD